MLKRRDEAAPEQENKTESEKKQSKYSVSVYVIILFAAVMVLIMLSYFVQQRNSSQAISDITEQHSQFSTQALQNIEELQNKNIALMDELDEKDAEIEKLQAELEDAEAAAESAREELQTKYDTAIQQRTAMGKLLDLYMISKNGKASKEDKAAALEAAEPYRQYLDGAYAELYESLKNQLK